jgi:hypothetical protein
VLEPSGLYYPNYFVRSFLQGLRAVVGDEGYVAVMELAELAPDELPPADMERHADFAQLGAVSAALESVYGARGGRGLALRLGRAWFDEGFRSFGAFAGLSHPAFQSLDLAQRTHIGLHALAAIFDQHTDQTTQLTQSDTTYALHVDVSPMAWGRHADRPVCHALVGLVQACLHAASNGYEYHVYESTCCAAGHDECCFVINKKPIGQL